MKQIAAHIPLVLIAAVWLLPIVWMIIVAFKPSGSNVVDVRQWLVPNFTLDNFRSLLSSKQFHPMNWMLNSVLVATVTTGLVLMIAALAAYGFSNFNFAGKKLWMVIIMFGMMIPREATVIPIYVMFNRLNLLNQIISLILPNLALPMAFIILKKFFDSIPRSLYEAATVDGCGSLRKLFSIALPLSRSAFASVGIFVFLNIWNDFLWPFLAISAPDKMTVPIGILLFNSEYQVERVLPLTASTLLSIPVILVFFIFQKNIIKGVAMSGIKG